MKLQEFNVSNSRTKQPKGSPRIRLQSDGSMTFNTAASALMDIGKETRVKLFQDNDSPKDWYIRLVVTQDGFPLTKNNARGKTLTFHCRVLADKICESMGVKPNTFRSISIPLAKCVEINGVAYWPMLLSGSEIRK